MAGVHGNFVGGSYDFVDSNGVTYEQMVSFMKEYFNNEMEKHLQAKENENVDEIPEEVIQAMETPNNEENPEV